MNYFKYFPSVNYELCVGNTGFTTTITQITSHAEIVERLQQSISIIHDYIIDGAERPDNVAERIYGSPNYTWIILLLNNITSLYDWPLSNEQFNDYIIQKYESVEAAQSQLVYRRADGVVVDSATYLTLIDFDKGTVTSQYDEELQINDQKRRIKIIPSAFIPELQKELTSLFS